MSEYVVPDMIEPVVGWRVWRDGSIWGQRGIYSMNHTPWTPKEKKTATCEYAGPQKEFVWGWEVVSFLNPDDRHWVRDATERELKHVAAVRESDNFDEESDIPQTPSTLLPPLGWHYQWGQRIQLHPPRHEDIPGDRCSCGIYAYKAYEEAKRACGGSGVLGEVYLWGKIIEGTDGYRAQYAYPKWFHAAPEKSREWLLDYGVGTPWTPAQPASEQVEAAEEVMRKPKPFWFR